MTSRNISIGIDPTRSTAGARVVKRDLDSIGDAAQKTENQVNRAGESLGRLSGKGSAANDNMRRLRESAIGLGGTLGTLRSLAVAAGAAIGTIIGTATVAALMRYADTAKNLASQLRLVTSSSEELRVVQEQLFRLAQGSRSDYEATVSLYARLARSGKDLGLSQEALLKVTETVNKAFVVSGTSGQEASNAIRQLAQGLAAGALRGDEFNSVSEQAPRLLQAVADYLKMNVGQLRAFAAEGKITADVLIRALLASAEKINGEFLKMGVTIGAAGIVLRNSLIKAVGELDAKLGASDAIASGIIAVARAVDALVANMDKLYKSVQVASIVLTAMFAESILGAIGAVTIAIGTGLVGAVNLLTAAIMANPLGALAVGITAAVAAIYYFRDEIKKAIGVDVWEIVKGTANFIIGSFVAAYEDIKFLWQTFPDIIEAAVVGAGNKLAEGVNAMVRKTVEGINFLRELTGYDPLNAEDYTSPQSPNPAADRLREAVKGRNAAVQEALNRDYLGAVGDWWKGGSSPGQPPAVPGGDAGLPAPGGQSAEQLKKFQEILDKGREAIALQEAERRGLGLTEEAARALRLEQELLNKAKQADIALTPDQTQQLQTLAKEMASAEVQTKKLKESYEFNKSTFTGFFKDIKKGLEDGKGFWKSFADAAVNALNRITDRLMDRTFDLLFDTLFGGGSTSGGASGGGIFGSLASTLFGGGKSSGGGAASAAAQTLAAPVIPVTRAPLGPVTGEGAQLAWNFWKSKGLADHQVAGILGNISGESRFNPAAVGDAGNALGLYQWNDRSAGMLASVGPGWRSNPLAQHEFAYSELMGPESRAWQSLLSSKDVQGATAAFAGFERPRGFSWANPQGADNFSGRLSAAESALQQFGSTTSTAAEGLSSLGSGFDKFGASLSNMSTSFFPAAPSALTGGGGLFGWLGGLFGGFSPSGAQATLAATGAIGLFDSGGYTGQGSRKDVAGLVHRNEIVWSEDDIRRSGGIGRAEAMRLGLAQPQGAAQGDDARVVQSQPKIDLHVNVIGGSGDDHIRNLSEQGARRVLREYEVRQERGELGETTRKYRSRKA